MEWVSLLRIGITITCIWGALITIGLTGNYLRIRWYLTALFLHQALCEYWLIQGWPWYGQVYIMTSVPILLTAAAVVGRALTFVDEEPRPIIIALPVVLATIGLYFAAYSTKPVGLFLAIQAATIGALGAITYVSSAFIRQPKECAPYRTLGLMWVVQGCFFFLLAAGFRDNYQWWERVGEWLPAGILCAGLSRLSYLFLTEGRHEVTSTART